MLPKSKRQIYVGFDDGMKAVKYYNAETHKILTSCNFQHLNSPPETFPKPIIMTPSVWPEGESGSSKVDMLLLGETDSGKKNKHKPRREEEIDVDINELQKTWGIKTDYKNLH
jgi:hypothetical protein